MTNPVVVIGSNSFSGASFCRHLMDQGVAVIGISRSAEPIPCLLPYSWSTQKDLIGFHQLDINLHLEQIEKLLDQRKPNTVYNFAAQSMVAQSWEHPEHWFMTNTVSTIKLHNMLRQKDYLDRYVHISTPEVYGSCSGFINENQTLSPSTPYAVSRAAADMSLQTFWEAHGFPVVTTRAANVFGAGQQLYRIIPKTILSIMLGIKLPLHGGGTSERSFIHIDDVSSATQLIGENGKLGEVYHISTSRVVSIRKLVEIICETMKVEFEQVCELSPERLGKDAAYLLDTEKLRQQLGWQDNITLESGIEECILWVQQNFEILKSQPLHYIHKA